MASEQVRCEPRDGTIDANSCTCGAQTEQTDPLAHADPEAKELKLSGLGLARVPPLQRFRNLRKLHLSHNELAHVKVRGGLARPGAPSCPRA